MTGLGMVSPIGFGVAQSCAAARAGVTRERPLDSLQLRDPDIGEPVKAVGHLVSGFTDGFTGLGRLVRLGAGGLSDLVENAGLADWRDTALFVNLSSGFYVNALELAEMAEEAGEGGGGVSGPREVELFRSVCTQRLLPQIADAARLAIPRERQRVFFGDRAGFVKVLREATEEIEKGGVKRCVVGGIESCVEWWFVRALARFGILKTAVNPAGLIPGECAAFVLIESEAAARADGVPIEVVIEGLSERAEPHHRLGDDPPTGAALADSIRETLASLEDGGRQTDLILGTLNGDAYGAQDWGCALVRIGQVLGRPDVPQWHPALSFGEIGAASGPVAICYAARLFSRQGRYRRALVWLSSDDGGRGAFYMRKHPN